VAAKAVAKAVAKAEEARAAGIARRRRNVV